MSRSGPSAAVEEAAAVLLLRCGAGWWGGAAGRPGRRPGVATPGQIRMSLRAMKSAQEPNAVGMDPNKNA